MRKIPFFKSFLREDAPEMELFLENHMQYVIKLIYILHTQSLQFAILQKNCMLKNMSEKIFRHIFCGNSLPNTTLIGSTK